jgi:hypothetical protein
MPAQREWKRKADALFLIQKRKLVANGNITGPFEATITVSDASRIDLDNCCKLLLDTARSYGLIPDDGPRYMRKLTVQFGDAPEGARLMITPVTRPLAVELINGADRARHMMSSASM